MAKLKYEVSSGNVYEDLGFEDSTEMRIKAEAVRLLAKFIDDSGMTQQNVSDILGIDQPKISRILRGQFRGISLERIMSFMLTLGNDINITVHKNKNTTTNGQFHIIAT